MLLIYARVNSKLNVCLEQSVRYKQLASQVARPLRVFILYDKLGTPAPFATRLNEESKRHGLELRTYSMLDIKELYQKCMEELERTSGIYLGRPIAMNVTHLRLMNRLLQPFVKAGKSDIPESELTSQFNLQGSRTMYRVRRTMAENFDLLRIVEIKGSKNRAVLTKLGESFCENMVYEPLASGHEFALSHGQRRVLLESLTNGNFTKSKVNLYYLLRFIHITNGEWIPKDRRDIGAGRLTYLNNFFGTDYRPGPLLRLVRFTFTQCEELGLVDSIQTSRSQPTFQAFLTSLGSRVLGFLELYLHLKREQLQIPLQN